MISDRQEDQSQGFENTSMLAVGKCYEKLTCLIGGAGAAKGPMCCIPMACLGGVVGGILGAEGGMIIPFGVAGCCIAGASGKNLVDVQAGHVGVVLRFGRYHKLLPPGRHRINVMSDVVTEVATRVAVCDVPPQAVLTSDNLAITADAALYYSVSDAAQATFAVDDFRQALQNLGQVTMRAVIGEFTLEAIFAKRIELNERIKAVCSEQASTWGIVIDEIVLQSVKLPNDLEERLAAVAQSKREAEAQMIKAEADKAVAAINSEAAKIIKETPAALDLKWMETLKAVAANPARTIIVPPTQGNSLTLLPGLR
jgi:regulator of protease activity HflC (stomatin/prohibitin superfamily)